jgi:uncharacterized tellurite resistance protein B-like protein
MFLLSRLRAFLETGPEAAPDQPRAVATAALLVLVARADGLLKPAEADTLRALLRSRFALSEPAAARMLERAEAGDADAADLVEAIARDLDAAERGDLLALAYRVAGADGAMEEFEEDFVWRIGHLLGLSDGAIEAVRRAALAG